MKKSTRVRTNIRFLRVLFVNIQRKIMTTHTGKVTIVNLNAGLNETGSLTI